MLADGNGDFAQATGLSIDLSPFGLGTRSKRYAMIVADGTVTYLAVEDSPRRTIRRLLKGLVRALSGAQEKRKISLILCGLSASDKLTRFVGNPLFGPIPMPMGPVCTVSSMGILSMKLNVLALTAALVLFAGASAADARPSREPAAEWNPSCIGARWPPRSLRRLKRLRKSAVSRMPRGRALSAFATQLSRPSRIPPAATRPVPARALGAAGGCGRSAAVVRTSMSLGTGAVGVARVWSPGWCCRRLASPCR